MQHLKYVVRWTDQDGKNHSKEYDDDPAARKAKAWLIDRGAPSVDIAVRSRGVEYSSESSDITTMFPVKEQQSFIK